MKFSALFLTAWMVVAASPVASQNLLQNGSFESPSVNPGDSLYLPVANIPGWTSYLGHPINLCGTGKYGIPSSDGNNYIELDGSSSTNREGVYQDVPTVRDQVYTLSFDVRARNVAQAGTDDETVVVEWNGVKTDQYGYRALSGGWERMQITVIGTGGTVRVLFREATTSWANNGSGALLDNISLEVQQSSITGRLFIDSNENGSELGNNLEIEAPLPGQPVRLLSTGGSVLQTVFTDEDGVYRFNISPARYLVQVPDRIYGLSLVQSRRAAPDFDSDFNPVSGLSETITLSNGEFLENLDAGYGCHSNLADGEMICNGSFEYSVVPFGQSKDFHLSKIPGWTSEFRQDASLRLLNNADASEGSVYASLDSSTNTEGIYQDVPTIQDQIYTLSWDMRATNPNRADTEDEAIVVEWRGLKIIPDSWRAKSGEWETKMATVTGTGGTVRLTFRESTSSGASDGSGPFIDNISLKPATKLVRGVQTGFGDTTCDPLAVAAIVDSVMVEVGIFPSGTTVVETQMDPDTMDRRQLRGRKLLRNLAICRTCQKQWGTGVCRYWKGFCLSGRRAEESQRHLLNWENETWETIEAKCELAKNIIRHQYDSLPQDCGNGSFYCVPVEGYPGVEMA